MRISLAADELTGIAGGLVELTRERGHDVIVHGALAEGERADWAWSAQAVARDVLDGRAEQGIVCCWTGTGASIAANKVRGVRAALCTDAETAAGARRWNDANVLALSLRATSEAELGEILDAWFTAVPSRDAGDRANVERVGDLGAGATVALMPELAVADGRAAIEFYRAAFGARELHRVGGVEGDEAVVCQLAVGGASFWVADSSSQNLTFSPTDLGGGTVRMMLLVEDPDATQSAALAAGASEIAPVKETYGWRVGKVLDPFGHQWEIARAPSVWPPSAGDAVAG